MKKSALIQELGFWLALVTTGFIGAAQAGTAQLKQTTATPVPMQLKATQIVKPAACGAGFVPVNIKLVSHEGKKWYQYDCAQQRMIKRSCNADTEVTKIKDDIVSLPSDGQSHNSKLYLSYSCFHYVPVE